MDNKLLFHCLRIMFLAILAGCASNEPADYQGATTTSNDIFGDNTKEVVHLEQGWTLRDSEWFYTTTQGSDLMSYWVYINLEEENSTAQNPELLRSEKQTNRFRYLSQKATVNNPDGLPLGFVKDTYGGKDYIGYTCAACHTTQVNYEGVGFRIDGGPALADMVFFLESLEASLKSTLDDSEKMQRLADKAGKTREQVRVQVDEDYKSIQNYNELNHSVNAGKDIDYGYSRLDAFGRIFNRVLAHLTPEVETSINPANAPVSYPFLWDTPYHDFVQWNGIGDNGEATVGFRLGPLGRNVGEVLGVFGKFSLDPDNKQYNSSADKMNLQRLERKLQSLWSPTWDDAAAKSTLPPINQALKSKGKEVYEEYQCGACHQYLSHEERKLTSRRVTAQFTSDAFLNTDTQMINNAATYCGKPGYFINDGVGMCGSTGKKIPAAGALSKAAVGVIVTGDPDEGFLERTLETIVLFFSSTKKNPVKNTKRHVDLEEANRSDLLAYKGRPLNGVWATAPYLHNGSVPNLYELFLPACKHLNNVSPNPSVNCRSEKFTIGSRELDAERVGLKQKSIAEYPGLFEFDTNLPGNYNVGHEYAAGITPMIKLNGDTVVKDEQGNIEKVWFAPISDEKRKALVEYVKSL